MRYVFIVLVSLVGVLATPAVAEESMSSYPGMKTTHLATKGTKTYQKRENPAEPALTKIPVNPQDIAPAAGEEAPAPEEKKTFHETLRLPRKN